MKHMKLLNTGAFAGMIAVNALANLLLLGGNTTARISETYPSLFTPAPYTFMIWGVIYMLAAVFVLYQWEWFDHGTGSTEFRNNIGLTFAVSCLMNILWIVCWHLEAIGLSLICIIALLLTLVILETRIPRRRSVRLTERLSRVGFDLYTGWIAVAAIANAEVLFTSVGISTTGAVGVFRTITALLTGAVAGILAVLILKKQIVGLAMLWAYIGILVRHVSADGYGGMYTGIIVITIICVLILAGCICRVLSEKYLRERPIACRGTRT